MGNGLGELGFWLAAGIVFAAMILSGAIKERGRERERQAAASESAEAARASQERAEATRSALLENAGANITEVLAYLRERDAAAAARTADMWRRQDLEWRRKKASGRQALAFVSAFVVGTFAFIGGLAAATTLSHPGLPRLATSPLNGRPYLLPPPPPPTGWAAFLPVEVMLGIWAAGLIIAVLIVWSFGRQTHDAQSDA